MLATRSTFLPILCLALAFFASSLASAQDPQPVPAAPAQDSDAELRQRVDARAQAIEQLTRGELSAQTDPGPLLRLEYGPGSVLRAEEVLAVLGALPQARESAAKKREPRPREIEPSPDLATARQRVVRAYVGLLRLPAERRAELLTAHATKRAQALEAAGSADVLRNRLATVERQRAQLTQFLAGELDPKTDPKELFAIDLGDDRELLTSAERTARTENSGSEDAPGSDPDKDGSQRELIESSKLERQIAEAELALDQRRLELMRLDPKSRQALIEQHIARREDADASVPADAEAEAEEVETSADTAISDANADAAAAAADRQRALLLASRARSEAKRMAATEEARLLGVKEAHALFSAELGRRSQEAAQQRETSLDWKRNVDEQTSLADKGLGPTVDLDGMYEPLREDLSAARTRLASVLTNIQARQTDVPALGSAPEGLTPEMQTPALRELREGLLESENELDAAETTLRWQLASDYRADIVTLNRARLALLEITSEQLRSRVTSFGPDGIRQVKRESQQIGLELQYRGLSFPRHAAEVLEEMKASPIPVALWVLEVGLVLLVFRWWRRRAEGMLLGIRDAQADKRPRTSVTRAIAGAAYYLERVRRPLEWLAIAAVLFYGASGLGAFPELELIWIVLVWLLLGSAVILFVDAIASGGAAGRPRASATAKLRLRSLRLLGLAIVYTGLVLSLADALVGRGAIYAWVLRGVWIWALPILLLLLTWWKPHVFAELEREPHPSRFVTWVQERPKGMGSYVGAAAGGLFLMGRGITRWVMRHASTFEATRRVLAYLFRREVAKQAEATSAEEALEAIPAELQDQIAARGPESERVDSVAAKALEEVCRVAQSARSTISAVVAERGMGKSAFMQRLEAQLDNEVLIVACPAEGFPGLLDKLAAALALPLPSSTQAVAAELTTRGTLTICIDDAQRLVRPAIGGLSGLDEFGALARQAAGSISWVVAIGAPAWQYINRARGERLFFNQVVALKPWTEEQIGELLRRRTTAAGLEPSFDGLVVPRQYDEVGEDDEARSETGFFRILWDYANGNPYVATYFWARSLFTRNDGETMVRLFIEPSPAELDGLALTLQFTLRALIQLETATKDELVSATRLSQPEIDDAVRFLRARGYLEDREGLLRVRRRWFRAISNMLRRQHLLAA